MNPAPAPDMTNPLLSWCEHARAASTKDIRLLDVLDGIRTGRWRAPVEQVRAAYAQGDKPKGDRLKLQLPGVIFAGRFMRRADDALVEPSGITCLDFDHLPDPAEARARVSKISNVIAAFISPSGAGLKVLVQTDARDAETHKARYRQAMKKAHAELKLEGDPASCNMSRLCFVSYDKELFHNPEVMLYRDRVTELQSYRRDIGYISNLSSFCLGRARGMTVEEIIARTLPTCQGQRNRSIFDLARGLKYDLHMERDPAIQKPIVRRWHERALPVIGTKPFDDTWADFQNAWDTAKTSLQGGNPVGIAWAAIQSEPMPKECEGYDSEPVRMLLALCRKLGEARDYFMLPAHQAGELIGMDTMRAHRYLKMFVRDGHLEIIELGTRGPPGHRRATKYRWVGLNRGHRA